MSDCGRSRSWIPMAAQMAATQMGLLFGLMGGLVHPATVSAAQQPSDQPASSPIRQPIQCPNQLEALMPLLLRDLPSYANRVSQRAYSNQLRATADPPAVIPGYVLLAGRPEYEPLSLAAGEYRSISESEVPQVFFTTLERQYFADQAFELQHYHWLFLTPIDSAAHPGWRLVLMRSRIGDERGDEPPSPPRDSSQGVIAQAIRLWLRDCEAGSIAAP